MFLPPIIPLVSTVSSFSDDKISITLNPKFDLSRLGERGRGGREINSINPRIICKNVIGGIKDKSDKLKGLGMTYVRDMGIG